MKKQDDYSFFGFSIWGKEDNERFESRVLEQRIQRNILEGHRRIEVKAFGQHGIGGRLWCAGDEKVHIRITGSPGQRTGSLGFPNTFIEVMESVSDDVGWLNAGAEIVVHGNAGNGAANAMAQGKILIAGNIGARGMTMTKHNPRFDPPELWVLGSVGDYFAEFMAGGKVVICGHDVITDNVLGYRPCVGMVGGMIFVRGKFQEISNQDAKITPISDAQWQWLCQNMETFLNRIERIDLLPILTVREQWKLIIARSPTDRYVQSKRSILKFRKEVWEKELGKGGIVGDLLDIDNTPIPVITNGDLRRFVPVWENKKYAPPCQFDCPTGIPIHERWRLIREGRVDEAVDMALAFTPFPASVCGYLCPNLCMKACTRRTENMPSVDITKLGKASINAKLPKLPPSTGKKIAIIGGGPAGISVAWQLRQLGHEPTIYDQEEELGGKLVSVIPNTRVPEQVIKSELQRIRTVIEHVSLKNGLVKNDIEKLISSFDYIIIAVGANKPRNINVPGKERAIAAMDFLRLAKLNKAKVGENVVVIGAGNVGCDIATEASRLGAKSVVLLDVQEPASFGKEREAAELIGAKFKWPFFTKEITPTHVLSSNGESIPADTVVVSIGDQPDLAFLENLVGLEKGFIKVTDIYQTTHEKIFAIGDAVRPGLLTDAIGAGRVAAQAIDDILNNKRPKKPVMVMFDRSRIHLAYFDPRTTRFDSVDQCGAECASCGSCRDCGLCATICPQSAISRQVVESKVGFEMAVDSSRCIGCGFCMGACPSGVWRLIENSPLL